MDSYLPNPADSILWSDELMGNSQGPVTTGPFANWSTFDDDSVITRKVGAEGSPFTEADFDVFMKFTDVGNVLAFPSPEKVFNWIRLKY